MSEQQQVDNIGAGVEEMPKDKDGGFIDALKLDKLEARNIKQEALKKYCSEVNSSSYNLTKSDYEGEMGNLKKAIKEAIEKYMACMPSMIVEAIVLLDEDLIKKIIEQAGIDIEGMEISVVNGEEGLPSERRGEDPDYINKVTININYKGQKIFSREDII